MSSGELSSETAVLDDGTPATHYALPGAYRIQHMGLCKCLSVWLQIIVPDALDLSKLLKIQCNNRLSITQQIQHLILVSS